MPTRVNAHRSDRHRPPRRLRWTRISPALIVLPLLLLASCATTAPPAASGGPLRVVAAENVWGDLAAQIGGDQVTVDSIINSPAVDPHDYEPVAADARAVAAARILIVNGLGYDSWATKLASANPAPDRTELNVGSILGIPAGGNPHQWYSPTSVRTVIAAITSAYQKADPSHADYFASQQQKLLTVDLAPYFSLIDSIKSHYGGTPIGASESIVTPLAQALGLKVLTPPSFLLAISEGTDPTAADKATIDHQIATKQIAVYVYNIQNTTPDVQAQVRAATAAGIPVVRVSETPTPDGTAFATWQVRQLTALQQALAKTGAQS